ncbi:chitobiase/beta-hexosaminidase-like protein [Melghirimyces profundicolus]|uniref:Chitobiase/beta-hexosaminidase-like protein n=1 Tax=Melghirimyces profundicolus TaxID=1242148 RepID=A0A2T6C7W9_9BACL|nr:M14 family metallopeptidase [Melghirimyces profundicolus]PTX64420.1 chitobiase/beta-hexosaminidase-like protein [Melghirimyces profundicolus]
MRNRRAIQRGLSISLFLVLLCGLLVPAIQTEATESTPALGEAEEASLVRLVLPDRASVNRLAESGVDLAEYLKETPQGVEVDAVLTPTQRKELADRDGVKVKETLFSREDWEQRVEERDRVVNRENTVTAQATDTVKILRADYFQNDTGQFLSVEAKTSDGTAPDVSLTAHWDDGASAALQRFEDAGVYLYHRMLVPVEERPDRVKVTSNRGGEAEDAVKEWLGEKPKPEKPHYVKDFISHYMTPTEVYERMEQLAEEFPELAEIVELPNKTQGYRRKSQAVLGNEADRSVVVTSRAWGHEGGNDLTVELKDPGRPDQPLTVEARDQGIRVTLATDGSGAVTTTATRLAEALNREASQLISAHTYRGSAGEGIVEPQGPVRLDNHLSAPDEVSRDPFRVRALRIGKHRDGSRTGVLAYAQEHAREWVTPLVTVETAERLLRNYAHDPETRKLVNNLDIFIIPSVNPDGAHYSFYDYNWQRKNLRNRCDDAHSDPGHRHAWGTDVNRNYGVGSLFDGFTGASTNCLSAVFAGKGELSEEESRNVIHLADRFDNIKFAMNVHSYGGYFMWSPGAYKAEGREPLPRPSLGEEAFFWGSSERILSAIKEHRGTVILPGRTGPVADVLYSAAGNSADHLWYEKGIFAWNFEVGADRWNPETREWESVGFQPPFEEGHEEAMEFSNGLIELFRVAYDYGKDRKAPRSKTVPRPGSYGEPVEVQFETSEPATIFYTTDGSRPTFESDQYRAGGLREGPEAIRIEETTTLKWFSVDAAGNIEGNYDPHGDKDHYRKAQFKVR